MRTTTHHPERGAPVDALDGRVHSEPVDAEARILSEDEGEQVERLIDQRYRIDRYYPLYRLVRRSRPKLAHTRADSRG